MSTLDYVIKHPLLKGMKVSDAIKQGKIKELIQVREFLSTSFNDDKNAGFAKQILTGITSINYYLLEEYSSLMAEFQNKYSTLTNAKKQEIVNIIKSNKGKLETNDIFFLQEVISRIS